MKILLKKILLFPISVLYYSITSIRNIMFDFGLIKSTTFKIPIISVGNLTVGGTGKTPHTEFLLSILSSDRKTAMLSRGYKRKTSGFVLGNENSDSNSLGDEPFQIHQKFLNVVVAVDEKRVHGVIKLINLFPDLETIILDDAYQHRYVKPGFSILLTDYNNLYIRDRVLPLGRLRESRKGSKRADVIIVTKCPATIQPIEMRLLEKELNINENQQLFFSSYKYNKLVRLFSSPNVAEMGNDEILASKPSILVVSGIVSPKAVIDYLQAFTMDIDSLNYPDHYNFQSKDFVKIKQVFDSKEFENKIIVVTEKDAARIKSNSLFPDELKPYIYALPIQVEILNNQEEIFTQKIKEYVIENSRNR